LLLISFLINPLLFLALLLFIVLFSLANNPDIAIAPSFLVGFGLMIGIPLGVATGVINLVSWSFTLWCLGGAIIFWAADCGLYRLLTKENIVLSSKGD
jgi:ABC-2 type transport system permease protein